MLQHVRLRVYVLHGKRTLLAWCRDSRNTWESELKNGEKPEELRGVTVDFSAPLSGKSPRLVRIYDPWANHWSDGKLKKGKLELPEFSRSTVVRMSR